MYDRIEVFSFHSRVEYNCQIKIGKFETRQNASTELVSNTQMVKAARLATV